ncbi:hypothetical protein GTH14_04250 [Campylobacter jejuni]|nr:hypothetical protein [Campylobacter jejuni]EJD3103204.1 hypothetical protein [Campylobacter jejuni]HDZ4959937.1 hypothetical protein [Campylobacter jejuni]
MQVKKEEELAKAINDNKNYMEIEGDLANNIFKIKATGNVTWVIALGSIGLAAVAIIYHSKNNSSSHGSKLSFAAGGIGVATAGVAVSILGLATTISAIKIATAGNGKEILEKLRDYRMEKISDTKLILKK